MSSNYSTARFMQKVPPTPLHRDVEALHEMAYWSGVRGSALEMFEHRLMSIATFAHRRYIDGPLPHERAFLETHPVSAAASGSPTAAELADSVSRAFVGMRQALVKMNERNRDNEWLAEQRYKRRVAAMREEARAHLRAEVRRVEREVGLR